MQIAISRSPEFFVSDDKFGNVRVAVVLACTVVRTRPAPDVGIVGNTPGYTRPMTPMPVLAIPSYVSPA